MEMEKKSFKFKIKQIDEQGTFTGHASVFNNIDEQDDIMAPGAFTKTVRERKKFPLFWSHRIEDLPVGGATVQEDEEGLFVDGKLKLEIQRARELYELLKEEIVVGLSIGYKVVKSDWKELNGKRIRVIKEVKLYEISLTTFPANERAVITGVKEINNVGTVISVVEMYRAEMEEALRNWKESKQMPEGLLQGLCERVGKYEGFFSRCVEMSWGPIDDVEAYCAWLEHECLGHWPGEKDSISDIEKSAVKKALSTSEPDSQKSTQSKEPQKDMSKPDDHLLKELLEEINKIKKLSKEVKK